MTTFQLTPDMSAAFLAKPFDAGATLELVGEFPRAAFTLRDRTWSRRVTINAGKAVMKDMYWRNIAGLDIHGGIWRPSFAGNGGLRVDAFSEFSVSGAQFLGLESTVAGQPYAPPGGTGLWIGPGQTGDVTGNRFEGLKTGMNLGGLSGLTVAGNELRRLSSDGILFANLQGARIVGNAITDLRKFGGEHPDAIQGFATADRGCSDLAIEDNDIDVAAQGIFLHGLAGSLGFDRVAVRRNRVRSSYVRGISVSDARNVVIEGNEVCTRLGAPAQSTIMASGVASLSRQANTVAAYGDKPNALISDAPVEDLRAVITGLGTALEAVEAKAAAQAVILATIAEMAARQR